jgi:UDP-glucose 4-epimerase
MTILVTGGAGFIGRKLVASLLADKHKVVILDDLSTGDAQVMADFKGTVGSVTDTQLLERLFTDYKFDQVYHLAALARIQRSWDHPDATYQVNVNGTYNILEMCRIHKVPKVFIASSSSVYAGYTLNHTASPIKIDTEHTPLNPYAYHKHLDEQLVGMYRTCWPEMNIIVGRPFNVYGHGQKLHDEYATVIPKFANAKNNGEEIVVFGDGSQTRDFTNVFDVVAMIEHVMENGRNEDFNLCSGKPVSIKEVAEAFDHPYKCIENPRVGEAQWTWGDNNTGYKPVYNLIDYIKNNYA